MKHIATAQLDGVYVELLSVNEGEALVERVDGERVDVAYDTLTDVWPLSRTLDTFDELVSDSNASTATNLIAILTQTSAWAELVRSTWENLY